MNIYYIQNVEYRVTRAAAVAIYDIYKGASGGMSLFSLFHIQFSAQNETKTFTGEGTVSSMITFYFAVNQHFVQNALIKTTNEVGSLKKDKKTLPSFSQSGSHLERYWPLDNRLRIWVKAYRIFGNVRT